MEQFPLDRELDGGPPTDGAGTSAREFEGAVAGPFVGGSAAFLRNGVVDLRVPRGITAPAIEDGVPRNGVVVPAADGGAPCTDEGDVFHKTLKKASLRNLVTAIIISFVFEWMCLLSTVTGTIVFWLFCFVFVFKGVCLLFFSISIQRVPAWFFRKFPDDFDEKKYTGVIRLMLPDKSWWQWIDVKRSSTKKGRPRVMLTRGWRWYCARSDLHVGDRVTFRRLKAIFYEVTVQKNYIQRVPVPVHDESVPVPVQNESVLVRDDSVLRCDESV